MAQREVEKWITVKGVHIPIFKGESVEQALTRRFAKQMVQEEGKEPEPEFNNYSDAKQFYQDKFRNCSATYRSKIAAKLGITSRGDDKINDIATAYAQRWQQQHQSAADNDTKNAQINANNAQAVKASQQQAKPKKQVVDDPLNGILGKRVTRQNVVEHIKALRAKGYRGVNPHYADYPQPKKKNYHNNCAIATAAVIMQAMGYDVQAGRQPSSGMHYGIHDVLEIDASNPDNYILAAPAQENGAYFRAQNRINRNLQRDIANNTPNLTQAEIRKKVDDELKARLHMPNDSGLAAKAIADRLTKWGNGSFGQLSVTWSNGNSFHAVFIYNDNGTPVIFDGQNGRSYVGAYEIQTLLKRTRVNETLLVRWDNSRFVDDIQNETLMLRQMFKKIPKESKKKEV